MKLERAYIGIGSNLGDSAGFVREGFSALEGVGRVVALSDLYVTRPWGEIDQPSFVNAAAVIETELSASALMDELLRLESDLGRVRGARYGPRTIDFDLLMYDALRSSDPHCVVPHPQLARRAFALAPLAEIAGDVEVAGLQASVNELWAALPQVERAGVRRIAGTAHLEPARILDYDAPAGPATEYADLRPFGPFDRTVLDASRAALGPLAGRRVLDVGCGTGRFTRELAARGARVTGIDKSATMLAEATSHPVPAGATAPVYVRGDANAALPAGSFDAITVFYALQYLDAGALFARAMKSLVPGGRILVATFPHRHFVESVFSKFFPSMAAIDLARFPSQQRLERALREAGYDDVVSSFIDVELRDAPSPLIAKVERKYLSSFHLVSEAEFRAGMTDMRSEWCDVNEVVRMAWAIVFSGRTPAVAESSRSARR